MNMQPDSLFSFQSLFFVVHLFKPYGPVHKFDSPWMSLFPIPSVHCICSEIIGPFWEEENKQIFLHTFRQPEEQSACILTIFEIRYSTEEYICIWIFCYFQTIYPFLRSVCSFALRLVVMNSLNWIFIFEMLANAFWNVHTIKFFVWSRVADTFYFSECVKYLPNWIFPANRMIVVDQNEQKMVLAVCAHFFVFFCVRYSIWKIQLPTIIIRIILLGSRARVFTHSHDKRLITILYSCIHAQLSCENLGLT